jgi:hypothetical protein
MTWMAQSRWGKVSSPGIALEDFLKKMMLTDRWRGLCLNEKLWSLLQNYLRAEDSSWFLN